MAASKAKNHVSFRYIRTEQKEKHLQVFRFVQVGEWPGYWSWYGVLVDLYPVQVHKITKLLRQGTR